MQAEEYDACLLLGPGQEPQRMKVQPQLGPGGKPAPSDRSNLRRGVSGTLHRTKSGSRSLCGLPGPLRCVHAGLRRLLLSPVTFQDVPFAFPLFTSAHCYHSHHKPLGTKEFVRRKEQITVSTPLESGDSRAGRGGVGWGMLFNFASLATSPGSAPCSCSINICGMIQT